MVDNVPYKMNAQPEVFIYRQRSCFDLLLQPLFLVDHRLSPGHLRLAQSHCSKSLFPMVS